MTRLIDVDEAIKRLGDAHFKNYGNAIMVIRETPTVEAVPIEFIKSEIARMKEGLNTHHPECAIYAEDLVILIEEWEGSKKRKWN